MLVKVRTVDVSESNDCPKFDLILLTMASDGHEGLNARSVPAKMIQPTEGKLVWFLDKPAASTLGHQ